MSKRHKRLNVSGKVDPKFAAEHTVNSLTSEQLTRIELLAGHTMLKVCEDFDQEMAALRNSQKKER